MTTHEMLFNILELAGSHTKSMNPGIRDGFGTTGEVLARFDAYVAAIHNAAENTGGATEDDGA